MTLAFFTKRDMHSAYNIIHLDIKDSYVRMLFIDFSATFNTSIAQQLIGKLSLLGLNTSVTGSWIS